MRIFQDTGLGNNAVNMSARREIKHLKLALSRILNHEEGDKLKVI